ncbi:MAG: hypothetical protein ACWA5P_14210 [bacterium]
MLKKIALILTLSLIGLTSVQGQKELTKAERKLQKKKEKIEKLENSITNRTYKFIAEKIYTPNGKMVGGRGGIFFVRETDGEFMEFLFPNQYAILKNTSYTFTVDNYNAAPTFSNDKLMATFSIILRGVAWSGDLTLETSGDAILKWKNNKGQLFVYEGKVIANRK